MVVKRRYSPASTLWISCILAVAGAALLGEQAASQQQPSKLLFLTHAGLYKHTSLGPAERAVASWGPQAEFEVTALQGYEQDAASLDLSVIDAEYLSQFDGVMMMTNGNLPLTDSQKSALIDFVKGGGGFIGVHCAALTLYNYPEFGEMLGGYFRRTEPDRRSQSRGLRTSRDKNAGRQLAHPGRVLPVRHRGVDRRPSGGERGRTLRQPDPDRVVTSARACIAQHRHRENRP